jgi:hypothetical protein
MKIPNANLQTPKELQDSNLKTIARVLRFLLWDLFGLWNFGIWDFVTLPKP